MFSLCVPTMDRYNTFLKPNLEKYIENTLIDEIIITDENGNDYSELLSSDSIAIQNALKTERLKIFRNEKRLGPFLNKLKACRLAKNEWIALIDSDNFADTTYFQIALKYLKEMDKSVDVIRTVISPCFAKPNFNYTSLSNNVITRKKLKYIKKGDSKGVLDILMNTGNYIINKYLVEHIDLSTETDNIPKSSACDVIYFNTLLFEQLDLQFHVVKDLHYTHCVHPGSIYTLTNMHFRQFNQYVHNRFHQLFT